MSEANPMKAPTARHDDSLGQRPRFTEKRDSSPEGACHPSASYFSAAPSGLIQLCLGVLGRCPKLVCCRTFGALMRFASLMRF
jgi:hypothetical protein